MSENLFVSLTVAAVSALAWFAYNHPEGYRRIFQLLTTTLLTGYAFAAAWDIGASSTHSAMSRFIKPEHQSEAQAAYEASRLNLRIITVYVAASLAYLIFLRVLPHFFGRHAALNKSKDKQ